MFPKFSKMYDIGCYLDPSTRKYLSTSHRCFNSLHLEKLRENVKMGLKKMTSYASDVIGLAKRNKYSDLGHLFEAKKVRHSEFKL